MFFRRMLKQTSTLGAAAMLAAAGSPSSASEVLTEGGVKALVEQHLRGEILKIEQKKVNGRIAFAVTVMNAGGNANHAYQVYTLVIDAETGTLVPEIVKFQPRRTMTAKD